MKVKPLFDLTQHIGSVSISRVAGYPFDIDVETARKLVASGLAEALEPIPAPRKSAKDREVKG